MTKKYITYKSSLDRRLAYHDRMCRIHLSSVDNPGCSCGRDAAMQELADLRAELDALKRRLATMQMPLFAEVQP